MSSQFIANVNSRDKYLNGDVARKNSGPAAFVNCLILTTAHLQAVVTAESTVSNNSSIHLNLYLYRNITTQMISMGKVKGLLSPHLY